MGAFCRIAEAHGAYDFTYLPPSDGCKGSLSPWMHFTQSTVDLLQAGKQRNKHTFIQQVNVFTLLLLFIHVFIYLICNQAQQKTPIPIICQTDNQLVCTLGRRLLSLILKKYSMVVFQADCKRASSNDATTIT